MEYYTVIKKEFPSGSAVENLPAVQKMQVQSLDWGYPLEEEMATCSRNLTDRGTWWATVHGVAKESDMT